MDGSARKYAVLIGKDGTVEQDAPRKFINIDKPIEITDPSGAYVKIEPAEQADYDKRDAQPADDQEMTVGQRPSEADIVLCRAFKIADSFFLLFHINP